MEREQIPTLAKARTKVTYQGSNYTLIGYQVLYKGREQLLSVCLEDERKCLVWTNYKNVEE